MQFSQIDFTPLEQMKHLSLTALKQVARTPLGITIIAVYPILFVLVALTLPNLIMLFIFGGIFLFGTLVARQSSSLQKNAWETFAATNNWSIQPGDINQAPPSLLNIGYGQKTSEIINAQFDGLQCNLLTFEYTIGAGKNRATYYFVIAKIGLGKEFPHIVLDSQKNSQHLRQLPDSEQLKLEGDFNKFFKLYIPNGEEIDALSIITPNVMQTLIDTNRQQDIEIYGNCLYFIDVDGIGLKQDPSSIKSLLQSIGSLSKEIILRAQSLDYNPVTQPAVQPVAQPATAQPAPIQP